MIEFLPYFAKTIVKLILKGSEFFTTKIIEIINGLYVDPVYSVRISIVNNLAKIA